MKSKQTYNYFLAADDDMEDEVDGFCDNGGLACAVALVMSAICFVTSVQS